MIIDNLIEQIYINKIVPQGNIGKLNEEMAKMITEEGYIFLITTDAIEYIGQGKEAEEEVEKIASEIMVTSILLNKTTLKMVKGNTETLTATVIPENATNQKIEWKSSDEDIVVVENGTITAKTEGTATIVASITQRKNTLTASCQVEVILPIANTVEVGDYINYSVGNWTEQDIEKLGELYSGASTPNKVGFGGFSTQTSKDGNVITYNGLIAKYSGWRVLSKNAEGSINIIHAGAPEASYPTASAASYLETWRTRDCSMYEDSSTNSVNTSFAMPGSAHILTYGEYQNNLSNTSIWTIGCFYWLVGTRQTITNTWAIKPNGGLGYDSNQYPFGIRIVLTIKPTVHATAKENQTIHNTSETAWELSL